MTGQRQMTLASYTINESVHIQRNISIISRYTPREVKGMDDTLASLSKGTEHEHW